MDTARVRARELRAVDARAADSSIPTAQGAQPCTAAAMAENELQLQNFSRGEWRAARSGFTFEVELGERAPGEARERLRVARSAEADAVAALEALASATHARLSSSRELARAASQLASAPDPHGWLARRAGLDEREIELLHADLRVRLDAALHAHAPRAAPNPAARSGEPAPVALVRADATELLGSLAGSVFARLAGGWRVLIVSDPHAPMLATRVVEVLLEAGVARDSIALLHEDGDVVLRRAIVESGERLGALEFSGSSARVRALERWLHEAEARGARAPRRELERRVRVLANQSRIVRADDDVEAQARAIAHSAFARVPALGGQAPTVPGRVLCHERVFSRFTAALLAELAASDDVARPLRALDPALCEHVAQAFALGLDEGATAVFTPADRARVARSSEEAVALELAPLVFTNVEEHMRLAWLGRPAPILCLLRVPSEARALELAAELDRDPLAEDLSAAGVPAAPGHPTDPALPASPSEFGAGLADDADASARTRRPAPLSTTQARGADGR